MAETNFVFTGNDTTLRDQYFATFRRSTPSLYGAALGNCAQVRPSPKDRAGAPERIGMRHDHRCAQKEVRGRR
ncbi:MAG: hypothetical protein HYU31_06225 [Deltaproteobacteria bacterium]|nr:hypothetical protein [Deltaproteobacteria bacterium]